MQFLLFNYGQYFYGAQYDHKEYIHKFSWTLEMDRYFPGFNSFNWQKKELIISEKYCKWLGNIFAYPGFIDKDDHWEKFGRHKIKGNWGSFVTARVRVSLPATRKVGFRWQNPENISWVARLDWRESLVG
jgi:hypothetical protein